MLFRSRNVEVRGADGRPVRRRIELKIALGNADDLDRIERGLPQQANNLVKMRRQQQADAIRQRFTRPLPQAVRAQPDGTDAAPGKPVREP